MHYHIAGKLVRTQEVLRLSHEEFVELIKGRVLPTLTSLVEGSSHGTLVAGGLPAGSRDVMMIVDLRANDSHQCVRSFLNSLPIFDYYEWTVTPLEMFSEILGAWSK